jgi:hypothetical protein
MGERDDILDRSTVEFDTAPGGYLSGIHRPPLKADARRRAAPIAMVGGKHASVQVAEPSKREKPQLGAGARGPLLGGHGEYAGGRTQINGLARPRVPYLSADGEENAAGTIPTAWRCPLSSRCPRRREHRLRRRLPPRRMSAQHRRKSRRRLSPLWQQIPNVWPEVANPAPRSRRPTYGRQRGAVSPRRPRPAERSALPPLSM